MMKFSKKIEKMHKENSRMTGKIPRGKRSRGHLAVVVRSAVDKRQSHVPLRMRTLRRRPRAANSRASASLTGSARKFKCQKVRTSTRKPRAFANSASARR